MRREWRRKAMFPREFRGQLKSVFTLLVLKRKTPLPKCTRHILMWFSFSIANENGHVKIFFKHTAPNVLLCLEIVFQLLPWVEVHILLRPVLVWLADCLCKLFLPIRTCLVFTHLVRFLNAPWVKKCIFTSSIALYSRYDSFRLAAYREQTITR